MTQTRRAFFQDLVDELRSTLPESLSNFHLRQTANLVKIFYSNERVHFEVWVNGARGTLEVGLHFEDGLESTEAYLSFFDDRIVELKHRLGASVELERWTPSWGHLYEVAPLPRLEPPLVQRTGQRLSVLISVLQPLVEQAGIALSVRVTTGSPRAVRGADGDGMDARERASRQIMAVRLRVRTWPRPGAPRTSPLS